MIGILADPIWNRVITSAIQIGLWSFIIMMVREIIKYYRGQ